MSALLLLIGGADPEAPMGWAQIDDEGAVLAQGVLAPGVAAPIASPQRTVLVLPGADARVKLLDLPARTQAQARAGAPFLFEGVLAENEDMHWAVGAAQNDAGQRLVAAIAQSRLKHWLARCAQSGAKPHWVTLDFLLTPAAGGEVTIAATPSHTIVAAGAAGGFTIEPDLAPLVFSHWLAQARITPRRIVLIGGEPARWREALGAHAPLLDVAPAQDLAALLARGAVQADYGAPNLLQGAFGVEAAKASPLKLWRFAALLAAAAFLLQVGSLLIHAVRDGQAARQITVAAERDFQAVHPGRIVNFRAQVTALTNQVAQSGRHPLLTVAEPLAAALRRNPAVRVDDVRHQAPGRSVRVMISGTDQAGLEAVIAALRAGGVQLDRRDVSPRDGRYSAELSLEAPL